MFEIIKKLLAALLGGGKLDASVINVIKEQLLGQAGGLGGLVEQLKAKGLDEAVTSWIGTGKNLPVSPAQIADALGSEKLAELAGKAGLPVDTIKTQLAKLLPQVVDQMTPGGKLPE